MIAGVNTSIVANTKSEDYHIRAQRLRTNAAENGHTEAMYFLANNERNRNRDEAIRWYKAEAEAQKMYDDILRHKQNTNS